MYDVETEDCAIEQIIVSMEGTGNLQKTMSIDNVMDKDVICSGVVGLVGVPFSIETTSDFDNATLSFKIDQTKLGDTDFNDLLFLWYDEDNYQFVELDTIYNEANSLVSIETTHFSRYMIVDKYQWFEAWSMQFNYNPGREHVGDNYAGYNKNYTVLTIDCSDSMSSNDPIKTKTDINSAYDAQFSKTCGRISASEKFISLMMGDDLTSIILFNNYAFDTMTMTDNQEQLKLGLQNVCNRGGTEFLPAIKSSLDMFSESELKDTNANKRIILLSDGFDFYQSETKRYLSNLYDQHNPDIRNRVKIYTIALGSGADEEFLEEIATITNGIAYKAYTANELVDIYSEIGIGGDFDITDTDGDGLYDAVESAGIRLQNGQIIYTDPTNDDTENDGLTDGEEIDPTPKKIEKTEYKNDENVKTIEGYYFVMKSDPLNDDSDNDGLVDEFEVMLGTNPMNTDSDNDNLSDGEEVDLWYDPTDPNPDNDSYNDAEELTNGTSPFVYDLNALEKAEAVVKGFFGGDFVSSDNIEILVGQVAGSFVPLGADARDYFANVFVNLDTGAALLNVGGFALDFIPIAGSAGDAAKVFPRVAKFIAKYADDAPKAMEAIIQVTKYVPNADDVIPGVVKALPVGAIDDITDSLKSGTKITKSEFEILEEVAEATGKNGGDLAEIAVKNSGIFNFKTTSEALSKCTDQQKAIDFIKQATGSYGKRAIEMISLRGEKAIDAVMEINGTLNRKKCVEYIIEYGDDVIDIITEYGDEAYKALNKCNDKKNAIKLIKDYGSDAAKAIEEFGDEAINTLTNTSAEKRADKLKDLLESVCFIAGTKISTNEGLIPIEKIEVGMTVLSQDSITGKVSGQNVTAVFENQTDELITIQTNGERITSTTSHPFYVYEVGWTAASELRAGDRLCKVNGEYSVVEWIEHQILENPVTVYNFEVEDYHTYFVGENAVLVHNSCDYNFDYVKQFEIYTGHAATGHVHHGLPKKHIEWFKSKGIDIDSGEYYFDLPEELHTLKAGNGVHTNSSYAGKTWDAAWDEYINKYPDTTKEKIEDFLNDLAKEFKISDYRAVKAGG